MLRPSEIEALFQSPLFRARYEESDDPTCWAALPPPALDLLIALARQLKAATAFEFGSGRSTVALLGAGLTVTSLEDSSYWMAQTVAHLSAADRIRHTALVRPLRFHLHRLIPVLDWTIDAEIASRLQAADLILVDAPFYTAFRERTLGSALAENPHAVVILDDSRVPTLSRFCDRIAADNPGLLHARVRVGHVFDVFATASEAPLRFGHTPLEILKGWRRFLLARKYAPALFGKKTHGTSA
jgi:hypothetical protein